jgi:hypothetical protein
MSEHVHVRIRDGVGVSGAGELTESFHCRCGETWTKTYPADGGRAEE